MLTFAVMLAAGAALPNYTLPLPKPARCTNDCTDRYRLPAARDNAASLKYRALAEDGTDCNVTRSKICRVKPRTWVRATY